MATITPSNVIFVVKYNNKFYWVYTESMSEMKIPPSCFQIVYVGEINEHEEYNRIKRIVEYANLELLNESQLIRMLCAA